MSNALATALKIQEDIIEAGIPSWKAIGVALANIHDHTLWRNDFDSFEDYCDKRWGYRKRYAQLLIKGIKVASEVAHHGARNTPDVASERISRELARAPEGERADVLAEAAESSPYQQPTAKEVRNVVEERKAASPAAPKDQLDRVIKQDYVANAFARTGELAQLKNKIAFFSRELKDIDDVIGAHLNRQQIETDLRSVAANIRFGLPYAVCPYCKGEKCEHCRQVGWVPKEVYGRMPDSVKK